MNYDPKKKTITISTQELFGEVLMRRTLRNPDIAKEREIRKYIGAVITRGYLESEFEAILDEPNREGIIIDEDLSQEIAIKIMKYAATEKVDIVLTEEYFEGLESAAQRAFDELEDLRVERDLTLAAVSINYVDQDGVPATEDDIFWIDRNIEVAESAKEVLEALDELRDNQ